MSGDKRASKRRKLESSPEQKPLDIKGAFELHDRLHFRQSIAPEVKSGLNDFKTFLNNILQNGHHVERQLQLKVLKQYCDDQASSTKDQADFPDVLSTWSFAAQSNEEGVLSAAPAALATFLRTISTEIDFREFGLSLCHTLLKRDQLRLIERGLAAPKSKGHLISPCLRLLTEITAFDGGSLAGNVFARRDMLFTRLDLLLEPGPASRESADTHRPSIRRMAQRLLIALMKHLDPDSKAEIITQGKTLHTCIRFLPTDGEDIVLEFLQIVHEHILESDFPIETKRRFLNAGNLSLLAQLYAFAPQESEPSDASNHNISVRQSVHNLLIVICTSKQGISITQSGWYPPGVTPDNTWDDKDDSAVDLGLDSPYYFDDYTTSVPVKNGILSSFVQTLKPEKDVLQAELLTEIFSKMPELVADYFSKKQKFSTPPKDDPVWRGHFALLFSVVQLPVPRNCGWHTLPTSPPSLSIVIESILPRPLDRATISRCFNMNEDIMIMSAARLVTVALEKFRSIVKLFRDRSNSSQLWLQAISMLTDLVIQRAPVLIDVINALQRTAKDNFVLRGAILECLAAFHRNLPSATAGSRFDISPVLTDVLERLNDDTMNSDSRDALLSQLPHIVTVASLSGATKWWHKPETQRISPFIALLRFCASNTEQDLLSHILPVVDSLLTELGVLHPGKRETDALITSLSSTNKWSASLSTYEFIDNCVTRTTKQPVKYLNKVEAAQQLVSDQKPLSLLVCCIAEQWSFLLKREDSEAVDNIAEWIGRLFAALESIGENFRVMMQFEQEMSKQAEEHNRSSLSKSLYSQKLRKSEAVGGFKEAVEALPMEDTEMANPPEEKTDLEKTFGIPSHSPTSLQGLERWDKADFESEMNQQGGRLFRLVQCVSSPDEEIRRQTHQILQSVRHYVDVSTYTEKQQLQLVLGELCETVRTHGLDKPVPAVVAEMAVLLLHIISDPADQMYGKANRFLMRGPGWDVRRLISYWVDKILLSEPEVDNDVGQQHHQHIEVTRLLDMLINGLRDLADVDLYRRSNVFERVLAYYSSPPCTTQTRRKILHLVYRAVQVGGADTLITRTAIRAWLDIIRTEGNAEIVIGITAQLAAMCSREYIEKWENSRGITKPGRMIR